MRERKESKTNARFIQVGPSWSIDMLPQLTCLQGMLKPDMHSFADWDEEVHGPIDADDTRREFPENFLWTCCQEDGVSVGCVNGLHQPANPQKKPRVTDV